MGDFLVNLEHWAIFIIQFISYFTNPPEQCTHANRNDCIIVPIDKARPECLTNIPDCLATSL
ncbi:MAG: hypothetical protein LBK82_09210 [Planctomycetaceae bacterium]|nr:hypothetical protein [Planctomycetaceae bacterium]